MSAKILPAKTFLAVKFFQEQNMQKKLKRRRERVLPEYQGFNQLQFKDNQIWKQSQGSTYLFQAMS